MEKEILDRYNEEKKTRVIEKKISGWWYFFLNFYFIITMIIIISALITGIVYIYPHLDTIGDLINKGIDYLKEFI